MTTIRLLLVGILLHTTTSFHYQTNSAKAWTYNNNGFTHRKSSSTTSLLMTASAGNDNSIVNNNVVLRPSSEDPDAFDSFQIGSAKVHRYTAESNKDDDDGAAEYVMWYHGRSQNFDDGLPQLSTGRIGRAVSRNGLQWKKVKEGSLSEDTTDVSLGLNKDAWWSFDTSHVGLGQVLLPMSTPAIIAQGGVYIMYYMGGNFEETPLSDYTTAETSSDKTIKGMKLRIGVALSQDGVSWGRVEGDDSTGACIVPYDKNDPDQDHSADLEEELYCGWPEVAVSMDDDTKEKENRFLMYYSTMTKETKEKCIACAISPDGFRWTKKGICTRPSDEDDGGCARCNVLPKASFEEKEGWSFTDDGYIMFYEGVSKKDNKHRIMMAESDDGFEWRKKGIVLDVGTSEDSWDYGGVGSPHIIRLDDGSMRMYYTGQGGDGTTAIGTARLYVNDDEDSSATWKREQAEFALN